MKHLFMQPSHWNQSPHVQESLVTAWSWTRLDFINNTLLQKWKQNMEGSILKNHNVLLKYI